MPWSVGTRDAVWRCYLRGQLCLTRVSIFKRRRPARPACGPGKNDTAAQLVAKAQARVGKTRTARAQYGHHRQPRPCELDGLEHVLYRAAVARCSRTRERLSALASACPDSLHSKLVPRVDHIFFRAFQRALQSERESYFRCGAARDRRAECRLECCRQNDGDRCRPRHRDGVRMRQPCSLSLPR